MPQLFNRIFPSYVNNNEEDDRALSLKEPEPSSLSDSILGPSTGVVPKTTSNEEKKPIKPPKPEPDEYAAFNRAISDKQKILNQLEKDGVNVNAFKDELQEARDLYKDEKRRNEALGLAQLIGNSISRMGSAIYGNRMGRSIGDQISIPTIDYEKRNEIARQDFRDTLAEIEARRREAVIRDADEQKQRRAGQVAAIEARVEAEKFKLQNKILDNKQNAANEKAELTANMRLGKEINDDVERQLGEIRKKEKIATGYASALARDDSKEIDMMTQIALKEGVPIIGATKAMKAAPEDESGIFGGLFGNRPSQKSKEETILNYIREQLRPDIEVLLKKQQDAQELMRTGKLINENQQQVSTKPKEIVHKDGQREPYSDALWKAVQKQPNAKDFKVE